MAWNYAELSKAAKQMGGPEALTDFLVQSGRKDMLPWMALVGLVCTGAGAGITKLIDYYKLKRKESEKAVEAVKKELIQGINHYDAEHPADSDFGSNDN